MFTVKCARMIRQILLNVLVQLFVATSDLSDSSREDIANKASNSYEVVQMTKKYLDAYARTGLRTLCISKKVIKFDGFTGTLCFL